MTVVTKIAICCHFDYTTMDDDAGNVCQWEITACLSGQGEVLETINFERFQHSLTIIVH